ncbi:MAG: helix-turn-helix transcriptional regulator [Erysipelotrichaceae bacterium]|nr:helix-turn-helix transcriptional regulator [Erysipelotrichaceae bacterium]
MSNENWLKKQMHMRNTIRIRLRKARRSAGMTQTDLGNRLDVSYQMIQQYENGKRTPSDETIYRLSEILGTDPEWIKYGSSE